MNVGRRDYAERRAARIERLRARAAGKRVEAHQRFTKNDALLGVMNGTPVLRGHHSERRHRRDLDRIARDTRKGIEAAREAEALARRAAHAESNTAISSDDPEALVKLRAKVAEIETTKERMKECNALIRKARKTANGKGADETLAIIDTLCKALGWTADRAAMLAKPDCFGNIGFADFELTNRSAEVRRLKARIATLEARAARPAIEPVTIGDVRIVEDENRIQIFFHGKPDADLRTELKRNGFRWSPSAGAWQRMTSQWALDVAKRLAALAAP